MKEGIKEKRKVGEEEISKDRQEKGLKNAQARKGKRKKGERKDEVGRK